MKYIEKFSELSRLNKQLILFLVDLVNLYSAIYWSYVFRFNTLNPTEFFSNPNYFPIYIFPIITIPLFIRTGLYRAVLKHINLKTLFSAFYSISISILLLIIITGFYNSKIFPFDGILAVTWFLSMFSTVIIRYLAYLLLYSIFKSPVNIPLVAIYGAGDAGVMLADSIHRSHRYKLKAIIDDDKTKEGTIIQSIKVYSPSAIKSLIASKRINMILLAIPSISKRYRREILEKLSKFPIRVMELPSIENIIDGNVTVNDIKKVQVEDILSRDSVEPISDLLGKNIANKSVLITGAGGSIGSELSRQVYALSPKILILYELSEFNLYSIHQELKKLDKKVNVIPILGSVQHKARISNIYKKYKVKTVYHAAAYKHVPMVEFNPCAGAYNNIIGTYNVAKQAQEFDIETFVFISTDKAVRPTNIMGATKRFSEMILKMFNEVSKSNTVFSMVRFGNVLDSDGSVLPLFRKQIREGGPLTVTHKDVIRYFMSIPEAVQLVIQAGAMAKGGEVFLLDMGAPINILDMAKKMIYLSGLTPIDDDNQNGDIEIKIIGLRPGEKLYEELLIDDNPIETIHPRIMKANEKNISSDLINEAVKEFKKVCKTQDSDGIRNLLIKYVDGYNPIN